MASSLALVGCSKKDGDAKAGAEVAAAQPMPKAGLWELTVTAAALPEATKMQVCVGEPTPGSNPFTPPQPNQTCAKNNVVRTAGGYAIDMECASSGMTMAIKGDVTGDFSSAYRVDMTTTLSGANVPAGQPPIKSAVDAKYVGACPAGMTPGQSAPVA
ncbi:MAG: DUF3617 family protein [Phenylobacterium sp.]